jgi:uncharacterized protein (TIGR02284 family)
MKPPTKFAGGSGSFRSPGHYSAIRSAAEYPQRTNYRDAAHRSGRSRVHSATDPIQSKGAKTMNDEISTLNTLTTTLIDSVTGFEDAASNLDGNDRLQQLFRERASERQRVVEELRSEVRRLGGETEDSGSFLGKTHQRFLDLKAAIAGRDEKAIINEVERGEDYLKEKFETALNGGSLSGESRAVVERAYQSVRSGHDQVSALKHGLEA